LIDVPDLSRILDLHAICTRFCSASVASHHRILQIHTCVTSTHLLSIRSRHPLVFFLSFLPAFMSSPPHPVSVAAPASAVAVRASAQWDRCLENGAIKTGYGLLAGALAGFVLFRSRGARFGMAGFGAGMGAGMSWFECKHTYLQKRSLRLSPPQPSVSAASSSLVPQHQFASVANGLLPTIPVNEKSRK